MKKNYYKNSLFLFLLLATIIVNAQNNKEKQIIKKSSNLIELNKLQKEYKLKYSKEKKEALILAKQNNWKVSFTDNKGSYYELVKVSKEGTPIYNKTNNANAAISTRANFMHNGGGLGLNIEGQGMTAYVWDGGSARVTHQEYDGVGGDDRVSIGDNSTSLSNHGGHVTGTIVASGFSAEAKGMAPQAKAISYDWDDDIEEATVAATNGMLLSNHSYGWGAENLPDWYFGAYLQVTKDWDNLMYNAPYYLMVQSAGNDGGDNTSNGDPLESNSAYDKLSGRKTAKNSLLVANGQDASINSDGSLSSVTRNAGSSEGPTDDLRVKPDIMGNGTGLTSSTTDSDDSYGSFTGTSMSSPNVTGSLLLLQQYHNSLYGSYMKAATLKGLALHTADDTEMEGPDAHTGWGLMNTKKAAETIANNGLNTWISEQELNDGETFTMTVKSDGTTPLLASISWTDIGGTVNTGTANDNTPVLVNDLDIKLSQDANTFSPWKLTSISTNEKGDNTVDPYERVDISGATGTYTITISHKGTLNNGSQKFSLIVTGISSDFTINSSNTNQTVCSENDAIYNFNYKQIGNTTTNFTASNVPTGASLAFSNPTMSADGDFTVTLSNLETVPSGSYSILISADNGSEVEERTLTLNILHSDFSNYVQKISSPENGKTGGSTLGTKLTWEENLNAESYFVEVATEPNFATIAFSGTEKSLSYNVPELQSETVYYWRVRPDNMCGNGNFSEIFSFQTGKVDCSNTFTATDFTNAAIPTAAGSTAYLPISVSITGSSIINNITVTTDISHNRTGDLWVYLQEPSSLGSNNITLLNSPCGNSQNITNTTFDDSASSLVCGSDDPAVSGTIKPEESLSSVAGKDANGTWFLAVYDDVLFQGGTINSATINICTSTENTSKPTLTNNGINADFNTTYTVTNSDIEATSTSETATEQVYKLIIASTKGTLQKEGTDLSVGDTFTQDDINTGKISYVNTQSGSFHDEIKVDISNSANGWLGNQTIIVNESVASVDTFEFKSLVVWPNPANDILNIKINSSTDEKVNVTLFDLQGRKISSSESNSSIGTFTKQISTKKVITGIYLLKITQGNKETTRKIIISK